MPTGVQHHSSMSSYLSGCVQHSKNIPDRDYIIITIMMRRITRLIKTYWSLHVCPPGYSQKLCFCFKPQKQTPDQQTSSQIYLLALWGNERSWLGDSDCCDDPERSAVSNPLHLRVRHMHTHLCIAELNTHTQRWHAIPRRSMQHIHACIRSHTHTHTMKQASWQRSHTTGWCKHWPTAAGRLQSLPIPRRVSLWLSSFRSSGRFYCEGAVQCGFSLAHQYTWVCL